MRSSLMSKDFFDVGVKVRFRYEHDANIWRVDDKPGVIKSSTAYGQSDKMLIVHFGNVVVTAASSCFRVVGDE